MTPKSNLIGFVIRKDNGSNNSLFLSFQMGWQMAPFSRLSTPHCQMEITPFQAPFAQRE
jgi:hypothetical protein